MTPQQQEGEKKKKKKGVLNNIMTIAMENIAEIMFVCMYVCPSFFPPPISPSGPNLFINIVMYQHLYELYKYFIQTQ